MIEIKFTFTCCLLLCGASFVRGNCQYGSQLAEGRNDMNKKQYVDLDHPLTCSGSLVSLHFCFYTDTIETQSLYRFYFRIYRGDREVSLRQIYHLEIGIDIQPNAVNDQSLFCVSHNFTENEYVNVLEGDYMAVYVPSTQRPLYVVGSGIPGFTLYSDTRSISAQFFLSSTIYSSYLSAVDNMAMHISANIINLQGFINNIAFRPSDPSVSSAQTSTTNPTITTTSITDLLTTSTVDSSDTTSRRAKNKPTPTPKLLADVQGSVILMDSSAISTARNTDTSSISTARNTDTSSISTARNTDTSIDAATVAHIPSPSYLPPKENSDGYKTLLGTHFKFWYWVIAVTVLAAMLIAIILIAILLVYLRRRQNKQSQPNQLGDIPDEATNRTDSPAGFPYEMPKTTMNRRLNCNTCTDLETTMYETLDHVVVPEHMRDAHSTRQHQDTVYSMAGPDIDSNIVGDTNGRGEMHYEMDIFNIYSGTVSVSSMDLTTRIRKVMFSLKVTTPVPYHMPASEEKDIYEQLSMHNSAIHIPSDRIRVTNYLGSGQFASVQKGKWFSNDGCVRDVAIKTLHADAEDAVRVKCLQEAAIMAQFHHPNVVCLHGIVSAEDNNISLVMEFLHGGDLKHILKTRHLASCLNATTPQVLLNYGIQVTLGMLYLSEKGFVHRDLAARNVLVSDRDVCKIGDFGMSRDLEDSNYYRSSGGTFPVKWTAPEAAFYRKFSTASDVWSYGCLLYEIWSLGQTPFSQILNTEVLERVMGGFRLPPPPGCPYNIYKLMIDCWSPTPDDRPGFKDILTILIGDEHQLLKIPFKDAATNREASHLGAPLAAGYKMYTTLQAKYLSTAPPEDATTEEQIYESIP